MILHYNFQAFKTNEIVPDILKEAPAAKLSITYPKVNKEVTLGNILTPTLVKDVPHVTYDVEPGSYYTLLLTDPDAPSRKNPVHGEWQHWLVSCNTYENGEVNTD